MKKGIIPAIILFAATGLAAGTAAYLYGQAYLAIIRIGVVALAGAGMVLFLYAAAQNKDSLPHDNGGRFARFTAFYLVALAAAVLFPLLPESGWPFLVIFVVLGLLSNQMIGVAAAATLLMISVLLGGTGQASLFFSYFLAGTVGIVLFSYLDEAFRVGLPLFSSICINLVCIAVNLIMLGQTDLDFETLFIVFANLLLCVLLLLVFLRYFSTNIIGRDRNRYMEINDPECPILVELKQKSKLEYYQAVHTAYLSDKIAKRLGLDDMAAKTCGYYHKIGTLRGENSWEVIEEICRDYGFPAPAIALLKEYTDRETALMSKEAAAVLFADTLVASILYIFSKNPRAKPDYEQIIDAIYDKKLASGILDKCLLTLGEMKDIRKMLKEEHLYYDFLR